MSPDVIAAIRPMIIEALDGPDRTCVTFEVDGDTDKWVQFVDWQVNAHYPRAEAPKFPATLLDIGDSSATISSWEPATYVTFDIPHSEAKQVAEFIDRYFVIVLGCVSGGYDVNVSFQYL